MTRKQMILIAGSIAGVAVLLAGVLFGGFALTAGNRKSFPMDGYILEVRESEEAVNVVPRAFPSGGTVTEKFPDSWKYNDIEGEKCVVSTESFLHFADGSFSAFKNGTLVDMDEVGNGVIEFFNIGEFMVLSKGGTGWNIDNNDTQIDFPELLWEVTPQRFMAASDKMELTLSSSERIEVTDFIEIEYIDRGILQIATSDQIWRTLSSGTKIRFNSGAVLDLGEKSVYNRGGEICFHLGELDDEGNLAVNLQSSSAGNWKPPTFIIHNDDGEDGEEGEKGELGTDGEMGSQGTRGKVGEEGGKGEDGAMGGRANGVIAGEENNVAAEGLGRVMITDISGTGTDVAFKVVVPEEGRTTFERDTGKITVREASSSKTVWQEDIDLYSFSEGVFNITGVGLKPDTEYIISIESSYIQEMESGILNTGKQVYVTRSFFTTNDGMAITDVTINNTNMTVTMEALSAINTEKATLTVASGESAYSVQFNPKTVTRYNIVLSDVAEAFGLNSADEMSNLPYTLTLSLADATGKYQEMHTVSGNFLKATPEFGQLLVKKENSSYVFKQEILSDPDKAFTSCEFVILDKQSSYEIQRLYSANGSAVWYYDEALGDREYVVKSNVSWYDNSIKIENEANSVNFFIPASDRLGTSWENDETLVKSSSNYKRFIAGNLTIHGDKSTVVKDQVVTATLATTDMKFKKNAYINLATCKWTNNDNTVILPVVIWDDSLDESQTYTLTIRGQLVEAVFSEDDSEESEVITTEILYYNTTGVGNNMVNIFIRQ